MISFRGKESAHTHTRPNDGPLSVRHARQSAADSERLLCSTASRSIHYSRLLETEIDAIDTRIKVEVPRIRRETRSIRRDLSLLLWRRRCVLQSARTRIPRAPILLVGTIAHDSDSAARRIAVDRMDRIIDLGFRRNAFNSSICGLRSFTARARACDTAACVHASCFARERPNNNTPTQAVHTQIDLYDRRRPVDSPRLFRNGAEFNPRGARIYFVIARRDEQVGESSGIVGHRTLTAYSRIRGRERDVCVK